MRIQSAWYLFWLRLAGLTGTLQALLGSPEHLWWQSGLIIPHHHAHHPSLKMFKHTCNSCFVFSKLISRSCKENHQMVSSTLSLLHNHHLLSSRLWSNSFKILSLITLSWWLRGGYIPGILTPAPLSPQAVQVHTGQTGFCQSSFDQAPEIVFVHFHGLIQTLLLSTSSIASPDWAD